MRRRLQVLAICAMLVVAVAPLAAAEHTEHDIEAFDASGDFGDEATLTARLVHTEAGGFSDEDCPCPEEGEQVDFLVDGEFVGTDRTDENGEADLIVDLDRDWHPGDHTITARYDTEDGHEVTDTAILTISEETTELEAHDGYLEAQLTDDEDDALVGEPVNFTVLLPGGQEQHVCTAFTDGTGTASCLPFTGAGIQNDAVAYRADYAGDEDFRSASDTASWL